VRLYKVNLSPIVSLEFCPNINDESFFQHIDLIGDGGRDARQCVFTR